jgi:hypothetical protein
LRGGAYRGGSPQRYDCGPLSRPRFPKTAQCHRVYKLLRLDVRARPDWPLEIMGIFAEVAGEAEIGLPSCKLS